MRKHVERASTDLRAVITTYEGKHNHNVPPPRGSGGLMNNINNNNNNMDNYAMTIRGSAIGSPPIQTASDAFFSTRPDGLGTIAFSRYENSMNYSFPNQVQQQNQLQHLEKQGHSMFSKAKEEPRDDLFIDSLRN